MPVERGVVARDLMVSVVIGGFGQFIGQVGDANEAAGGAHHQRQGRAGVAVSHVDDVLGLLDIARDRRLELVLLVAGRGVVKRRIVKRPLFLRQLVERLRDAFGKFLDFLLVSLVGGRRHEPIEDEPAPAMQMYIEITQDSAWRTGPAISAATAA